MKINTLDLTKTLSDYLFLGVENPEEKAKQMFVFKHTLTPHGFEKYIEYYFSKIKKYSMSLNGGTYKMDKGIDLKGVKYVDGKNTFVIIQCKKHSIKDITEDNIAHFYGKVIDKISDKREKVELYYITTSKFTYKAKKFGEETGIKTIDFSDLYKAQEIYSLEQFKSDILEAEGKRESGKCFEYSEEIFKLYENFHNVVQPTQQELYILLKQIRRDYSNMNQMRLGDIATNETLDILARERPHNLEALKLFSFQLSTRERNKILKHGEVFTQRLKYLHWEDFDNISHNNINIIDRKKGNFLTKIIDFF